MSCLKVKSQNRKTICKQSRHVVDKFTEHGFLNVHCHYLHKVVIFEKLFNGGKQSKEL